jgi:pSer/pThr/pTyr-binding forkhead associated (FHA) protein
MKINLVVAEGAHAGKVVGINKPEFFVGRDPQCHLRPASISVSKKHCCFTVREERAFLRDLNSTNGTFVNDRQVKGEIELHDGDRVKLGPLSFVVKLSSDDTAETRAVDKGTAVDKPRPAAPAKARSKPKAPADEDAVAEMLLKLDEEEEVGESAGLEDEIPGGSTIMELLTPQVEQPREPYRPKAADKPEGTTQKAAKDALEKYARRRV